MKNLIVALILILGINQVQAQKSKTVSTFKVEGNCEMCEIRIEKAANSVNGVFKANWNVNSKTIKVTYDSSKTNLLAIHQAISETGYQTDQLAANKKGYNALPFCCKVNGACEAPKKE